MTMYLNEVDDSLELKPPSRSNSRATLYMDSQIVPLHEHEYFTIFHVFSELDFDKSPK